MKHTARFGIWTPLAIATSLLASAAVGQAPPDYGHDFVTVGSPGNRPTSPEELDPARRDLRIGAVPYPFRVARTEITVAQWLEFARAYLPFNPTPADGGIRGQWIDYDSGVYFASPFALDRPVDVSWRFAARYANWLHNGKLGESWAFESGAYDASTFTTNPDGTLSDRIEHLPGARFWIPTRDEWTKATYFDPNRHGIGREGYWPFPSRSIEPLVSATPQSGGQTDAGFSFPADLYLPVGSFPGSASPWGLLDTSGGQWEWASSDLSGDRRGIAVLGSRRRQLDYEFSDELGSLLQGDTAFFRAGVRLASAVPSPGVGAVVVLVGFVCTKRRTHVPRLCVPPRS